jgi:hypothetical protein
MTVCRVADLRRGHSCRSASPAHKTSGAAEPRDAPVCTLSADVTGDARGVQVLLGLVRSR